MVFFVFFGFCRFFRCNARLIGNPGLSRGISVCFSVVVAWWTLWKQFGAVWTKIFRKIAIFGYFLELRKITRNWLRNPSKLWKRYQRPCDSFPTLQRARIYHLEAIWDSFCGDFPINCPFSAILRSVRKLSTNSSPTLTATSEGCQKLPTSQRTHSYFC